jgi:translocation and assembly module TamB
MSLFDQMPPDTPEPPARLRRHLRRALWLAAGAVALTLIALVGLGFWANSSNCENLIRERLIAQIETATGGRVQIASFHWRPFHLEADAGGLVLHGREAAGEAPYLKVDDLRVRLSILGFWSPRILLRSLDIVRPTAHLIIYADGSTNQPEPRTRKKAGKPVLDTLFDLKAGHVAVEQGAIDFENRAASFDFQNRFKRLDLAADDVSVRLVYVPPQSKDPESFHVEAGARDFQMIRGETAHPLAPPVAGYFQATLDLTRHAAYLRSLRLTARSKGVPDRTLQISGSLSNFSRPRWDGKVTGDLDMRLLEPTTGYPDAPEGEAHLNLAAQGEDGEFRVDGTVHADNASYIGTGVNARGIGLEAHVHADPQQLRITSIVARLQQGGQLAGEVILDHWLPAIPGGAVLEAAPPPNKRSRRNHKQIVIKPPVVAVKTQATPSVTPINGKVTAQLENVTVDTILDLVAQGSFQRLGLDAHLNGPATATWINGDARTLAVSANLAVNSPGQITSGEVPAAGTIDATYTQSDGAVNLRMLDIAMPASHLVAHGHLGAYPLNSPSNIGLDFHSHNLREFDTVLRDLGFTRNGKAGIAALPVSLGGQADFAGTWTGSLVAPRIAGRIQAANLTVELPPVNGQSNPPRYVRLDSLDATGSYSAARISVDHAELHHGPASIALQGTLTAATNTPPLLPTTTMSGLHKRTAGAGASAGRAADLAFDANSQLSMHMRASSVNVAELLPLLNENLPVTGQLSAQVETDGPLRALNGSGWAELQNGTIYGEPVSRVHTQGEINGSLVQLASLTISGPSGTASGSGSYNLKSQQFRLNVQGSGIDVARVQSLRQSGMNTTGKLSFNITGTGTLHDPHADGHITITDLALGGEPIGSAQIAAHAANRNVTYDITTRLQAAQLTAHGQTALNGDYNTQARFNFSQFNIGAILKLARIPGLTAQSALAGTVTVEGPLAHPDQLRGDARLQDLAATVVGVHLHSEGGAHATLANGRVSLDPLHITGEETDLHLAGGLDIQGKRRLDLAASGTINMKLAETLDPDVTASGTTTFQVEAHGTLQNPGLRGRIDFQNASIALEDLPNSLSQLHGTLEFNQNRLEVRSLTAMSGGGLLSVTGYLAYQHGIYADLALTGKGIRLRYPQGVSSQADASLHLQGTQNSLLLSGNVLITRFTLSPDLDFAALAAQASKVQPIIPSNAPSNHVRLDVHITSSPQLNFQNAYAKLAGDVDLHLRGTLATPSLLGRISITEGSATIAGTRYDLERGDITFSNPVRIEPAIDLNATAHVQDYDITLGLHGSLANMAVTYRSDPPLPESDVVALLALGRTQDQERLYTQQQEQAGSSAATDALLGGALNATVSSRVQRLFGAGSVKVDPNYLGVLGNSTTRITVEEQLGRNVTLTYATDVDTTAQQLLQAEIAINRHVSLLVSRDESGVFSMVIKATRRYR